LYAAAGPGESTTDLAWDGHALVYENANLLAESERFSDTEQRITADIDLDRLRTERMRLSSFNDSVMRHRQEVEAIRRVRFALEASANEVPLRLPRTNVLAYTMPGFATSQRTRENAWSLMKALGVSGHEIDIRPSCLQMLRDLDHPFIRNEPVHDLTFENVQAGERTSHLFRL